MDTKTRLISFLIFSQLISCSSIFRKDSTSAEQNTSSNQPTVENSEQSPADSSTPETTQTPEVKTGQKKKVFAVWIEGIGYDAVAAIGFLQELEKHGFIPKKIVGTGFGCWTAIAWGLEGSSNQAEWQAFKWNLWDYFSSSWLKKIQLVDSKKKFEDALHKLINKEYPTQLKAPVDCPILEKNLPHRLLSARNLKLSTMVWTQLMHPALGIDEKGSWEQTYLSGLFAGTPLTEDFNAHAKDIRVDEDQEFVGWIYLRSRKASENVVGMENQRQVLVQERMDRVWSGSQSFAPTVQLVQFAPRNARTLDSLKDLESRRRWLLDGRAEAQVFMNNKNGSVAKSLFTETSL